VREIWERVKPNTHPCQEDVLTGAELCALAGAISDNRNTFKTGVCQILAEAMDYFKIKIIRKKRGPIPHLPSH